MDQIEIRCGELTPTLKVARDTSSTTFNLLNCTSDGDQIGHLGGDIRADTLNMSSPNNLAAERRRFASWKYSAPAFITETAHLLLTLARRRVRLRHRKHLPDTTP